MITTALKLLHNYHLSFIKSPLSSTFTSCTYTYVLASHESPSPPLPFSFYILPNPSQACSVPNIRSLLPYHLHVATLSHPALFSLKIKPFSHCHCPTLSSVSRQACPPNYAIPFCFKSPSDDPPSTVPTVTHPHYLSMPSLVPTTVIHAHHITTIGLTLICQ